MKFLKTFLASVLGTIIGIFLLLLILFATIVSSSSDPEPYVRSNTILKFNLSGDIPARVTPDPFEEIFNPSAGPRVSLQTLKRNLEKAASHDNIDGVWIRTNQVTASWANLASAYDYLQEYKESGKFLYFSTDDIGMNEKAYFLASVADSVFTPPETNFEFDGFVTQISFYREMLDKIGIEPEIFRVGEYKSAVEPFIQRESSPESEEQIREILNGVSGQFVRAMEARTGKSADEIHDMLNTPPIDRLQFALDNGLVDQFAYDDEIEDLIKQRIGVEEDDDLRTISFGRYSRVTGSSAGLDDPSGSDKIAVIYASGAIMPNLGQSPFGNQNVITASSVRSQFQSALEDDDVKAIVFHINSGGGAATTSDLIWNDVRKAAEKKPVIAAMGSVAASGGYYIAAAADTIVAAENTITGSIGIFNLLFNSQELFNENLGIEFDTFKTHEYADLYDLTSPFTPNEQRVIQQNIENGYESFLNRMAESRGMTRDEVHEVGQGRVWTGVAAQEIGLVDVVGGIDRAIAIAAEKAEIDEWTIDSYPKSRDLFETLFSSGNAKFQAWMMNLLPDPLNRSETQDLMMLMEQPQGTNWALLPIRFDVN
ncbi:signal peptide peptidase SppA [Rhodohalobacter sp. SW132]|uniref:signal peptide peptidase SppA n=1 Tax=Rhodohalobacter sp. SW132 TaxID=2293433 RepID=UPI000E22E5F0|nr:signal peptide peptidase SppA [Rhodohalobacter sp. SW132]REL33732.1 signal peptide peptidase SppA [Rhodohalobacter sp. SW132]